MLYSWKFLPNSARPTLATSRSHDLYIDNRLYVASYCWLYDKDPTPSFIGNKPLLGVARLNFITISVDAGRLPRALKKLKFRCESAVNNETVSRQNLWAGNFAKSMTSEVNHELLLANRRSIYFTDILYNCMPWEYRSTINDPFPRGWLYSSVYLSIVCFGNGKVMGSNSD